MRPDNSVIPAPVTPAAEFHARGFEAILAVAPDAGSDIWTMIRTAAGAAKAAGDDSARALVVSGDGDAEGSGAVQRDEPALAAYGV